MDAAHSVAVAEYRPDDIGSVIGISDDTGLGFAGCGEFGECGIGCHDQRRMRMRVRARARPRKSAAVSRKEGFTRLALVRCPARFPETVSTECAVDEVTIARRDEAVNRKFRELRK